MRTAKTLIRLCRWPGFVGFVMLQLIFVFPCSSVSVTDTERHARKTCELPHDETNTMTAPSEDSDQPGHHADSEDSDQTGRMPRLIWLFAGHTCHFVGFVMRQLNCLCILPHKLRTHHQPMDTLVNVNTLALESAHFCTGVGVIWWKIFVSFPWGNIEKNDSYTLIFFLDYLVYIL